jgi:hypothetical protein
MDFEDRLKKIVTRFLIWWNKPVKESYLWGLVKIGSPNKFVIWIIVPTLLVFVMLVLSLLYNEDIKPIEISTTVTPILTVTPVDTSSSEPSLNDTQQCNKDATIKRQEIPAWKTYSNSKFKYEIQYPADWRIEEVTDGEDMPGIRLRKGNTQAKYTTSRILPEIYIVQFSRYSSSGALCSNQICDPEPFVEINVENYSCKVSVIRGALDYDGDGSEEFDYYAFDFEHPGWEIINQTKYPPYPYFVVSYATKEDLETITKIISTFKN